MQADSPCQAAARIAKGSEKEQTMYSRYEGPTVLGIAEKWERVLCYALGWITGIVFLIIEQRNHNVRRHAMQSILVFGALNLLVWIVGVIGSVLGHFPIIGPLFLHPLFWLVGGLIWLVGVVLWLGLMLMAYARPDFFLPLGVRYQKLLG
jgi:uncharacterized membrane protein